MKGAIKLFDKEIMAKNKNELLDLDDNKPFRIPQIDYTIISALRKKEGFKRSTAYSPIHGSNVVDKTSYVDNAGKVDIRNYDFIRDEKDKMVSDEELIAKYGTKYFEFTTIDKLKDKDLYGGVDYNKKNSENNTNKDKKEEKDDSSFLFISNVNDLLEEEKEEDVTVVESNEVEENNINNETSEFKLNINVDDDDTYEYNSYDNNIPKPTQTSIPSFLANDKKDEEETKIDDINLNTSTNSENTNSDNVILNKPIDRNITIEQAMENMRNNTYQYDETKKVIPIVKHDENHNVSEEVKEELEETNNIETNVEENYDDYYIPYKDIFSTSDGSEDDTHPAWLEDKKEIINMALKSFGIEGEVVTYTKGPAFTRYEVLLAPGVNVKKVTQIYENLQKDLQVKSLFLQTPIPGKNTVGIDVPNDKADVVKYGDLLSDEYISDEKNLKLALGKDIEGNIVYQNIPDMPHALIAGATQSGKSVCINTILISLLLKNSPKNLKLILVDPKKVELSFYNDLPHLATPVIDDSKIATGALKWAVDEMERRYNLLAQFRCRNAKDYLNKAKTNKNMDPMPYIVIVVDEFNDLIMQCGQEANDYIVRLAQKARAAGIHIILATQRPTVDVVSGTIKANITCRIAFRVASDVDSRTILDEIGAEKLLGRGDMFIKNNGTPERAQGAYVTDDEIIAVCEYITNKYKPNFLFTHEDILKAIKNSENPQTGSINNDVPSESSQFLFEVAMDCIEQNICSINFLQQRHNIGFRRASRIIETFQEKGIVSPKNGTKGREILIDSYKLKDMYNNGDL